MVLSLRKSRCVLCGSGGLYTVIRYRLSGLRRKEWIRLIKLFVGESRGAKEKIQTKV